jgi:hypothetical protein
MSQLDENTKKLAAIAYGEASTLNLPAEIGGIAFAVANRARAWGGKTVNQLLLADPNYTYAISDGNPRFKRLMEATPEAISKDTGMALALDWATKAIANQGDDPSNGAYWWDGVDFKTNYRNHPKVKDGFQFGDPTHNIFSVEEKSKPVTIYWKVRNKKTRKEVNSSVRGTYEYVWKSTAAHGKTIFWTHNEEYVTATGGKEYR